MKQDTNLNKYMDELEDPEYCPDNAFSHKHIWEPNTDLSGEFNMCIWCGVIES